MVGKFNTRLEINRMQRNDKGRRMSRIMGLTTLKSVEAE